MSTGKDFTTLIKEGNKKIKHIPIVPVVSGEVFLKDKVVSDKQCYVCKRNINKYEDKEVTILRISAGKMGLCCLKHQGIVQEFVKQFNRLPYDWKKYDKTTKDINIKNNNNVTIDRPSANKYRTGSRKKRKAPKRSR